MNYANGALSVNGEAVAADEEGSEDIGGVTYRTIPGKTSQTFRTTVPEDHDFQMGDNRDNTRRFMGPVARHDVSANTGHVIGA